MLLHDCLAKEMRYPASPFFILNSGVIIYQLLLYAS